MKIKNLLILTGIASVVGLGLYILSLKVDEAPVYVPRSEFNHIASEAAGAFDNYRKIKSNIYTGQVEAEDALIMQKALEKLKITPAKNEDIGWESMGPDNVGGRTRGIAPLNDGPDHLLAGGVSGGLFRTSNAGVTWEVVEGFDPYLIVSSIAQLGNGAIYVATGNSREPANGQGGSGFIGRGLFVSNDDGNTWDLVSDFQPNPLFTNSADWFNIDVIKADPAVSDRLWIGADIGFYPFTHGSTELPETPLFRTNSQGDTLRVTSNVMDFDISQDGQRIVVFLGNRLFVSHDAGETFEFVNQDDNFSGLPDNNIRTAELVISRQNSDFVYISFAANNGSLRGIYASVDGGFNWSLIAPSSNGGTTQFSPFGSNAQGWYDNMITSAATEESEEVIMGGIRMWRWNLVGETPGITVWEEVNSNFSSGPGLPPNPFYVHSDIHTDAWDSNGRLYVGTDGGVYRSDDNGFSWLETVRDYVTTQFYSIALNPQGQVLGGTQDNGTLFLSLEGNNPDFANQPLGSDGMTCEISQQFPDYMFMTTQNGPVFRSTDRGESVSQFQDLVAASNASTDFVTDIALSEVFNNVHSEIFVEYSPSLDSPWIQILDEPSVTINGDTIIGFIPAGTEIMVEADNNDYLLPFTTTEDVNYYSYFLRQTNNGEVPLENVGDTVLVQETPQFMLAAGLSQGTFVTRQPLKTNGVPDWILVDATPGGVSSMEWSPDGDHLYIGYFSGELVRISNFNSAWTTQELSAVSSQNVLERRTIHNAPAAITDIEVDYSMGTGEDASGRVAIAIGGYGGNGKIRVSEFASTVQGLGTFESVWNVPTEFLGMPAYSVVMDVDNPNVLLAGTEYGVWFSGDNGETWSEANNGDMVRVPVFDLRQQKRAPWNAENSGVVYAGSHGRGIFRTNFFEIPLSTEQIETDEALIDGLRVFPNPVTNKANIAFDLGQSSDVEMYIYSIDGQLVEAFQEQRIGAGANRQIEFDASDYAIGQYIIQLRVGDNWTSAKFVVTR